MKKLFVLAIASMIMVPSSYALSLRLHIPVSVSGDFECNMNGTPYDCTPTSEGTSLRGIFGLFGVGYTSSTLNVGWPSSSNMSQKLTANAADVSLSFLDAMVTVGYGPVIGGEMEGKYSTVSGSTAIEMSMSAESMSGSTSFLNLGFDVGPLELIAGYRMWDTKIKIKTDVTLNGSPYSSSSEDSTGKWNEMTVGVGFGF
jgi:hypothetical protein